MTWKPLKDKQGAREMYDKFKEKKARMLCKNYRVVEKDGDEKLTEKMKKYAKDNYKIRLDLPEMSLENIAL